MIKHKKVLLNSFALLMTISTPIITAVSCSSKENVDLTKIKKELNEVRKPTSFKNYKEFLMDNIKDNFTKDVAGIKSISNSDLKEIQIANNEKEVENAVSKYNKFFIKPLKEVNTILIINGKYMDLKKFVADPIIIKNPGSKVSLSTQAEIQKEIEKIGAKETATKVNKIQVEKELDKASFISDVLKMLKKYTLDSNNKKELNTKKLESLKSLQDVIIEAKKLLTPFVYQKDYIKNLKNAILNKLNKYKKDIDLQIPINTNKLVLAEEKILIIKEAKNTIPKEGLYNSETLQKTEITVNGKDITLNQFVKNVNTLVEIVGRAKREKKSTPTPVQFIPKKTLSVYKEELKKVFTNKYTIFFKNKDLDLFTNQDLKTIDEAKNPEEALAAAKAIDVFTLNKNPKTNLIFKMQK
ncbi:MAG: hypothetical protein GY679_05470 [Mycoplasma sp.]|nr:hypothetical protein [Mycoplasma sp.]